MNEHAHKGAFPSQAITQMMAEGTITGGGEAHVSPSSLDLTLSNEGYRVEGVFLPNSDESVRDVLTQVEHRTHDLTNPLECGITYLFRLTETFALPEDVYGYCNPKSTTGRNDLHVRVLADRVSRYDTVVRGFRGELWIAITPKSFPVRVAPGMPLSQIRFFNSDTRMKTDTALADAFETYQLLWRRSGEPYRYDEVKVRDDDGSLILTIDLSASGGGYECRGTNRILDMTRDINSHNPHDFFQAVTPENGRMRLRKGSFYILSSAEAVRVPPALACEMASMDERSGEFRAHYAGFIDPGWGWGADGEGVGRPLTLEVRPFEDIVVRDRQPIAKIAFEHVTDVPDVLYDRKQSNYSGQTAAQLSKYFAEYE